MATLKEAIEKKKIQEGKQNGDITAFILERVNQLVAPFIEDLKTQLVSDFNATIEKEVEKVSKTTKKGEKGVKGSSYVLTGADKVEIAGKIKVPVVEKIVKVIEKTEVIKEQPIFTEITKTEIIKEAIPETPEETATKLNTLSEAVEWKVIKGLDKKFEGMSRVIREKGGGGKAGGGGMGNWVHQQFTLTSASTTVTLSSRVAANGLAHIARYEGQVLDYGTHYTISGKIITLLFTPDDSTPASIFSIAYVRT